MPNVAHRHSEIRLLISSEYSAQLSGSTLRNLSCKQRAVTSHSRPSCRCQRLLTVRSQQRFALAEAVELSDEKQPGKLFIFGFGYVALGLANLLRVKDW